MLIIMNFNNARAEEICRLDINFRDECIDHRELMICHTSLTNTN